jgi:hypothetical protein
MELEQPTQRGRFIALVAAHMLLGLAMALFALSLRGKDAPEWQAIWFMALVCSEVLLLGAWAGLSAARLWKKALGLLAGTVWLGFLGASPASPGTPGVFPEVLAAVSMPTLAVALLFGGSRWVFARMERRADWQPRPLAEEVQFSLRSLIGLTILVALLLSLGRAVQWLEASNSSFLLVVGVLVLVAVLAAVILVWACLGDGRLLARLPLMVMAMAALGLVFPFYLGGPEWRYVVWPAMLILMAVYAGASLLVVRSCGYRLVRLPARPHGDYPLK